MVVSGGFYVNPSDIEVVLSRHAAVSECAVFGVDDAKWGEAVSAAVEMHDGTTATADEIISFVKQHLDSVKAAKIMHFTDNLPRSAVGKILRRPAKDLFG